MGVTAVYLKPSHIPRKMFPVRGTLREATPVIRARKTTPNPYSAALINSACPNPTESIIPPAIEGPMIRPVLKTAMFSDVAFRMSSWSTRSGIMAMREGMLIPCMTPRMTATP